MRVKTLMRKHGEQGHDGTTNLASIRVCIAQFLVVRMPVTLRAIPCFLRRRRYILRTALTREQSVYLQAPLILIPIPIKS